MAEHSHPKDGVATLAYVPAIHAFLERRLGCRPGMTWRGRRLPAKLTAKKKCSSRKCHEIPFAAPGIRACGYPHATRGASPIPISRPSHQADRAVCGRRL